MLEGSARWFAPTYLLFGAIIFISRDRFRALSDTGRLVSGMAIPGSAAGVWIFAVKQSLPLWLACASVLGATYAFILLSSRRAHSLTTVP